MNESKFNLNYIKERNFEILPTFGFFYGSCNSFATELC